MITSRAMCPSRAVLLTGVLVLSGCASTFNHPSAVGLQPGEMAVLFNSKAPPKHWPWIESVDGIGTGELDTVQLNIPPGKHVIEFQPNHVSVEWSRRYVCLDAAPGGQYYVDSELLLGSYRVPWNLYIRDKATQQPVGYEGDSCTTKK